MNIQNRRTEQRPKHGCARCYWWHQDGRKDHGRCAVTTEDTFWKHAPCPEYEYNEQVQDEIELKTEEA